MKCSNKKREKWLDIYDYGNAYINGTDLYQNPLKATSERNIGIMKVKDITETGFYMMLAYKNTEDEIIYEALENTDKEWLKDNPDEKIVIDEWHFSHEENGKKIYQTSDGIYALGLDLAEIDVEKIDKQFEIFGVAGCFLKEISEWQQYEQINLQITNE